MALDAPGSLGLLFHQRGRELPATGGGRRRVPWFSTVLDGKPPPVSIDHTQRDEHTHLRLDIRGPKPTTRG